MKKSVRILWKLFFIGFLAFILLLVLANFGVLGDMPSISEVENPSAKLSSEVLADDGTIMGKFYLEDRTNVDYKDISPNIVHALIATEDERFYYHSGIDGKALFRALLSMGHKGGASTITMQTAKNLFTNNWATRNIFLRLIQKIKEGIIAVKLERNFTKEEIIALYLNTVEFSDHVFGIRNASKTFFQKEPDQVNIDEAAVLVGMVNAPGLYNPRTRPQYALEKRNVVLNQMVRNKFLTPDSAAKMKSAPIKLNYRKLDQNTGYAPYFRDYIREELKQWCKENKKANGEPYNLYTDGLRIYTTLNAKMQVYAEEAVAKHLSALQGAYFSLPYIKNGSIWKGHEDILEAAMKSSDRWKNMKEDGASEEAIRKSFKTKIKMTVFAWNNKRETDTVMTPLDSIKYHKMMIQTGFMVMDPLTGEVKAWVGGINFRNFKFDHVNKHTRRQVGSAFKPILYSYAVENGFTPETELPPGPIDLGGKIITGSGGPMAICLAFSKNPGAAYLMNTFGVEPVRNFAQQCGIDDLPPYPSIALGAGEVSLFDMMRGYSMFPGGGINTEPIYITKIEDRNGNILKTNVPERKMVISEAAAYTMVQMMEGVVNFGTGRRLRGMGINVEMGGKTGTTNDNTDCWFFGYTPQIMGGTWVGCDDPFLKMAGEGNRIALPVWGYFMQKVLSDKTLNVDPNASFVMPESLKIESIMDYEGYEEKYGDEPDAEEAYLNTSGNYDFDQLIKKQPKQELGPESQQTDEEKKVLEEIRKQDEKKNDSSATANEDDKKKKGFFKRLFGKKDKEKEEE